jgi:hypothetical protein
MLKHILPLVALFLFSTTAIPKEEPLPVPIPIVAADTDEALGHILELSPPIYLIIVGLTIAVGALTWTVKILWNSNGELQRVKDECHESKLKIALSSTETVREAITLVQSIHEQVMKLNESETDRRLADVEIKNHLLNIAKDIDELKREIQKS